jgi:hypothetical protein
MKAMMTYVISLLVLASLASAAGVPNNVYGEYVEARTADVFTGACFANSEVGLVGNLAVFGWTINKGTWDGVTLDGLGVVGAVRARSTLGDVNGSPYPVQAVLIIDEKATAEQRLALKAFAQRQGGDLLQNIVRVEYQPIELTIENGNVHSANAQLTAGSLARIQTRAINKGDHVCSNEEVWYLPLTKLDHAMPAYTLAHDFNGKGLDTRWNNPDKRSGFVGSFHVQE